VVAVAGLDDFDFEAAADDAFHTVGHTDVHNVAAALLPVPDCFGRHDVAVDVLGSGELNVVVDAAAAHVELDIVHVVVHLDTVDACHDLVAEIQALMFHTAAEIQALMFHTAAAADSHFH
jgi:D-ribose pyranose/furanose isomerase RbsD